MVMQRIANPCTPVRFRPRPPIHRGIEVFSGSLLTAPLALQGMRFALHQAAAGPYNKFDLTAELAYLLTTRTRFIENHNLSRRATAARRVRAACTQQMAQRS